MQPVTAPYADFLTREAPREVQVTERDGQPRAVRDPRVEGDTLRGYTLVESCEPRTAGRRASCVQTADSVHVPVDDIVVLEAPQVSTWRTVAAVAGLGVLAGWTVFFLTFQTGF